MPYKIYLDPGHGGSDSGAVKYLVEKDINLTMALACKRELEKYGVLVKMSRAGDTFTRIERSVREADSWGCDYMLSIHNNAGGGDGFEVYHTYKGGKGRELAKNIETEVKAIGQNSRGLKTKRNAQGDDYYAFIRLSKAPAIILEGLFVDNKADVKIADTKAKQERFGVAYAKGILKTLGIDTSNKSEPTAKTYSVSVGTYKTKKAAEKIVAELKEKGYKNAKIV